jgi:hypothetical protein
MKLTDPNQFIHVGGRIRYLAARNFGYLIFGKNMIYENLMWFKRDLIDLGFRVSLNFYERKLAALEADFEFLLHNENRTEEQSVLSEQQQNILVSGMYALEDTLICEAQEFVIASPVPRRFALNHLLKSPGEILGSGVYENLTDIAKSDITFSCRCIAFECPTAAAFHILRCVEECVRVLYKAYFPRGDANRPWGALTKEIETKQKNPKPEVILIEHLNHIRKRFRNPTDHPEKIFEIEEAEDLVHLSVDVINRIMRDAKVSA